AYGSLDTAVSKGATGSDVMVMLAGSAYHLGDYQTAAAAAKKALETDPSNKEALAIYHFSKDQAPTVKLPSSLGELAQGRAPESMPNGGAGALPNGIAPAGSGFFHGTPPTRCACATIRRPTICRARRSTSTRRTRRLSTTARCP